jgi:hypothetical protein
VSFATITLCVASQRDFIVIVDFVIDSVRKRLDISPLQHLPTCHFSCPSILESRPYTLYHLAKRKLSFSQSVILL